MKANWWITANTFCIGLYICLASINWGQENVTIILRDDDNLVRWLEFCLPLLALATIFNAVYLFLILRRIDRGESWKLLISWTLIAAAWIAAFKYDRYRFTLESPFAQQEGDEIERESHEATRSAQESIKKDEAAGISPYHIDSAGGGYYHSLSGTNSSTSGSGNQNSLEQAEKPN